MLGLLMGGGTKLWLYASLAVAAIIAVATILAGAKSAGRNAERVDALRRNLEAARVRTKSEIAVRGGDDAAVDDLLRPPTRRAG